MPIRHTSNPVTLLPASFENTVSAYLQTCKERGNKANTLARKARHIRRFLQLCFESGCRSLEQSRACDVEQACIAAGNKIDQAVIRAFLKFICQAGLHESDLSTLVPRHREELRLPGVYTPEEILAVENSIDRSTDVGKRDYAMILLTTRYGMRTGDIAKLSINDIDWDAGRISYFQQKTGVEQSFPLIPEVTCALDEYIHIVRPVTAEPRVFLRMRVPLHPVTISVLGHICRRYFQKAGVDTTGKKRGPHTFRSSLATSMVNDDVPYESVRKILGHTV